MMAQRIGKLFLLLCVITSLQADPQIAIEVTDANGYETESVGVGVPFLITVEVSGDTSGIDAPEVEAYPPIPLQQSGTSSSIRTINGNTTVKKQYRYNSRIDTEGTYTVGPARIEKDGKEFVSEKVELEVTHKQALPESRQAAFLKIETSKKDIFIGEKITFNLRFYYANNDVRIEGIDSPTFDKFKSTTLKGPRTGKETIDGVLYRYQEWYCVLYPKDVGETIIPAVNAQVSVATSQARGAGDLFSFMDQMLGGRSQRQMMYSNALSLQVKPLPQNESSTNAVGHFTGLTAKVNLDKAAEGEGIVYTLELIGDGNFAMISHPQLQVPEGLRFYESNTHFKTLAANTHKKDFEYVIQGVQPGTYTIEQQSFNYFDTRQKVYKTLRTKPVKITITPGSLVVQAPEEEKGKSVEVVPEHELEDPLYVTKWRFRVPRSIDWFWFFLLVLLPPAFFIVLFGKRKWDEQQEKYAPHYGYKNAFKNAKHKVEECRKNGSIKQLYAICRDLFAARLKLPVGEISEARIERALEQGGMTNEQIATWRSFYADIAASSFGSDSATGKDHLCVVLLEWIKKFERVL